MIAGREFKEQTRPLPLILCRFELFSLFNQFFEQPISCFERLFRVARHTEVAHFSTRAAFGLAVKVQSAGAREGLPVVGFCADQIGHHRVGVTGAIAQRPACHGPDVLLELVDHAGLDGPVAGVVDAGRDLVHQ